MKEVKVLSKDGQKLMSTDLKRANKLIAKGEAEITNSFPLTIQMLRGTKHYTQKILKDHYSYEASKTPYTVPLGKMNVNDAEFPFNWELSLGNNDNLKSTGLLVGAESYTNKQMFISLIMRHILNNLDSIEFIFCDVNGDFSHLQHINGITYVSSFTDSVDAVQRLYDRMMRLYKCMEQHQVDSVDKLPYHRKNIILCVNDMYGELQQNKYVLIDRINNALGSLIRLGKRAGINVLLLPSKLSYSYVPKDLLCYVSNKLIIGECSSYTSFTVFEKDITNKSNLTVCGRGFTRYENNEVIEVQLFDYWDE
jgi:hypothetical protein